MEIEIINPEVIKNIYENHGVFACECYGTPLILAERVGKNCHSSGHMSGSRCEYIKFHVKDVDRGTSEQALRHEIGTAIPFEMQDNYTIADYSELITDVNPATIVKNMASFRYIDKDGFQYETPKSIHKNLIAQQKYKELMQDINEKRKDILEALIVGGTDRRQAVQDANFVLPRATLTSFTIGFTPEALIHFCHKRLCTRAQEFIREMAMMMKAEVAKYSPEFAEELVPHCEHLLWCPEGSKCCGRKPTKSELKKKILKEGD